MKTGGGVSKLSAKRPWREKYRENNLNEAEYRWKYGAKAALSLAISGTSTAAASTRRSNAAA